MIIPVSLLANMTDTSTVVGLLGWGRGGVVVEIAQVYMFIVSMVTIVTRSESPVCTWLPWQWGISHPLCYTVEQIVLGHTLT